MSKGLVLVVRSKRVCLILHPHPYLERLLIHEAAILRHRRTGECPKRCCRLLKLGGHRRAHSQHPRHHPRHHPSPCWRVACLRPSVPCRSASGSNRGPSHRPFLHHSRVPAAPRFLHPCPAKSQGRLGATRARLGARSARRRLLPSIPSTHCRSATIPVHRAGAFHPEAHCAVPPLRGHTGLATARRPTSCGLGAAVVAQEAAESAADLAVVVGGCLRVDPRRTGQQACQHSTRQTWDQKRKVGPAKLHPAVPIQR